MGHYDFKKDRITGEAAEKHLLSILRRIYPKAYKVAGKCSDYDIIIPEINKTIEVKNDKKSVKTGNIAIELNRKDGTLTGILASKADFWCIFSGEEVFFLETEALKAYATNTKNNFRIVYGGDSDSTQMVLVKIADLKQQSFFKEIPNVNSNY